MENISLFKDKTVLITGGTGSFGRTFAKRLLHDDLCRKVIIFSRDEWKQWEMRGSDPIYSHPKIRYFLGDVRDPSRLRRAFKEVHIVIHAAALKQVPAAEYNPSEFINTNVLGAMNIIDASIDCGVERVVALSTDKAVNPINLYGATKLCSDKLFVAGNVYVGQRGFPRFSVVRYGNVAASRGSIIPLWEKMLREGVKALPLTDKRMTRFWITLEQSVNLVIDCLKVMRGGEIFVPKIPSIHMADLAEAMAPGFPLDICGIRPGEKLHELMISSDDARHTAEFQRYYVILPEVFKYELRKSQSIDWEGVFVPDDFVYASNTNSSWLTISQIREFLKSFQYDAPLNPNTK